MSAINYEPPNLRDADGVVHHSYGEPSQEFSSTLCEYSGESFLIDPLYDSDELKITRAPVTCMTCLRVKEKRDARGNPGASSR